MEGVEVEGVEVEGVGRKVEGVGCRGGDRERGRKIAPLFPTKSNK